MYYHPIPEYSLFEKRKKLQLHSGKESKKNCSYDAFRLAKAANYLII
jgi:hypothetical protein